MGTATDPPIGNPPLSADEARPLAAPAVSRRDLLKLTLGTGAGLALDGLFDVAAARAATWQLKLSEVSEFTTSWCST